MKLADLLNLNDPLPSDPFERLLLLRAKTAKLNKRTIEVMTTIYSDYVECVDALCSAEENAAADCGSFTAGGEA